MGEHESSAPRKSPLESQLKRRGPSIPEDAQGRMDRWEPTRNRNAGSKGHRGDVRHRSKAQAVGQASVVHLGRAWLSV